jgi:hypothetical protein
MRDNPPELTFLIGPDKVGDIHPPEQVGITKGQPPIHNEVTEGIYWDVTLDTLVPA